MTYIRALVALIQREPIRTFAVIRSVGAVVLAFWPGLISPDQQAAILALGAVWFGVDEVVRHNVSPTATA